MKFETANLLDYLGKAPVVITTNGTVKRNGEANLGKGNAKEVGEHAEWLAEKLGQLITKHGNRVHLMDDSLISFPVEETWVSQADIKLVKKSAEELKELADKKGWQKVYMPLPGCGFGGLRPSDVISVLAPVLDDRFIVLNKGEVPALL